MTLCGHFKHFSRQRKTSSLFSPDLSGIRVKFRTIFYLKNSPALPGSPRTTRLLMNVWGVGVFFHPRFQRGWKNAILKGRGWKKRLYFKIKGDVKNRGKFRVNDVSGKMGSTVQCIFSVIVIRVVLAVAGDCIVCRKRRKNIVYRVKREQKSIRF